VTKPPSPLTAVLTTVMGCGAAWLGVELLGTAFADCDVGVNASANSYGLLYLVLPVLAAIDCVAFALAFRFSYAGVARVGPAPLAGVVAFVAAIVALGLVFWTLMAIAWPASEVPPWLCPGQAPRWWPSWLPI
jgi:hypothetical protein